MKLNIAVLNVSDRSSRGERQDVSGPALIERVEELGWKIGKDSIVPDDFKTIQNILSKWADSGDYNVILTTGGTGFTPRDITPEATKAVIDREVPGMAEAMRAESLSITPHAMLSRSVVGIRKQTLIVNLPGSPKAALENFNVVIPVLPHAARLLVDDPHAEEEHRMLPVDNLES